jgi:hypothetical protein
VSVSDRVFVKKNKPLSALGRWCGLLSILLAFGCEDVGKKSVAEAEVDLPLLVTTTENDVAQVRQGLPAGVKYVEAVFSAAHPEEPSFDAAREALNKARDKTQDLRMAKSTFFAVALPDGKILRNDQKQDLMVGKSLFPAFEGLRPALTQGYTESQGQMPEAAGVKGQDAEWVAAVPIKPGAEALGYYVTGWSWSAYAYRLQMALRSAILSRTKEGGKVPLTYVYVVSADKVYGAPTAPLVTASVLEQMHPLEKLKAAPTYSEAREIEGRVFGLVFGRTPALGPNVAVVIVRSET